MISLFTCKRHYYAIRFEQKCVILMDFIVFLPKHGHKPFNSKKSPSMAEVGVLNKTDRYVMRKGSRKQQQRKQIARSKGKTRNNKNKTHADQRERRRGEKRRQPQQQQHKANYCTS